MVVVVAFSSSRINSALQSAQDFLLRSRSNRGWWKDFLTYAGHSDEWVSAYVASILADSRDKNVVNAAVATLNLLNKRRFRIKQGWGFNRWTPSDADTTSWVLKLYLKLPATNTAKYKSGISFLQKHVHHNGGISTYSNKIALKRFTKLNKGFSFKGWCSVHTCVTASVAMLPEFHEQAIAYLANAQTKDGSWTSYWWLGNEYATCLAIDAVCRHKAGSYDGIIAPARRWAVQRTREILYKSNQPESFALANALYILAIAGYENEPDEFLQQGTQALLEQQLPDGSWPASARLRISPPDIVMPDEYEYWITDGKGGGSIITDKNRIYTTATVVKFLNLAARQFSK